MIISVKKIFGCKKTGLSENINVERFIALTQELWECAVQS